MKDIYLLKNLSAPLRRVDGAKEYVNPRGVLPVIPHLYISQMHRICSPPPPSPPPPPPRKVYEEGTASVKKGI